MSAAELEDIRKHIRVYISVFIALAVLTVVTVTASYVHFAIPIAIGVALIIATVKSSLVASFFMHLISERRLIYAVLLLTFVFFLALMFLPLLGYVDRVR